MDFTRPLSIGAFPVTFLEELDRVQGEGLLGIRDRERPILNRRARAKRGAIRGTPAKKKSSRRVRTEEDGSHPSEDEHPQKPETDFFPSVSACLEVARKKNVCVVGALELRALEVNAQCYGALSGLPRDARRARVPTKSQITLLAPQAILFPFLTEVTNQAKPSPVDVTWLRNRMMGAGSPSLICQPIRPQYGASEHPSEHTRDVAPLFYERAAALLFIKLLNFRVYPVVELAVYGPSREPIGLFFDGVQVKPMPLSQVKRRI